MIYNYRENVIDFCDSGDIISIKIWLGRNKIN